MRRYTILLLIFALNILAVVPSWSQPTNPSTPCTEDFEDFLAFASSFEGSAIGINFQPVFDIDSKCY